MITQTVTSIHPPTIVQTPSNRYVVYAGNDWTIVDDSFTLDMAMSNWKKLSLSIKETPAVADNVWEVENSKQNGYYTVTSQQGLWSCSCPGFGFRRDCKHVKLIKEKSEHKPTTPTNG